MSGTIVLTDTVNVTVTPLPVVDFGPDQNLCFGETLTLNATVPGGAYLWQDGSTAPTFTVNSAGTYSVTVTANNCSSTESINVAYSGALVVELGPDTTLCTGETLVVDATLPGGATYLWQDGSTNATFTVNAPGSYGVLVTRNGCSASASVAVGYNPLPIVNLGAAQSICAGELTTLDATTAGGSYLWQDGSTNTTFQADATGTYSVDVTVNGCTSGSNVDVTVIPLPVVDLGGDQIICPGSSVLFDGTTPGATYLWQDGNTDATYTAALPGIYAVTVFVGSCSNSDNATLSNYTLPVVDLGSDRMRWPSGQLQRSGAQLHLCVEHWRKHGQHRSYHCRYLLGGCDPRRMHSARFRGTLRDPTARGGPWNATRRLPRSHGHFGCHHRRRQLSLARWKHQRHL